MASSWLSQYASKPVLTELAKKYTHPTAPGREILATQYFLKSGLTPLELTNFATVDEYIYQWALDQYQASEFYGFTTAELRNLDAFAPSIDDPVDLTLDGLPIHPIYARKNWTKTPRLKHNPGYLIGDNINEGYYDATNPRVWEAILPALRLASQILMNAKGCAWYDALFFGPRDDIPNAEVNDAWAKLQCKYRRIRLRPPYISGTAEAHEQVQQRLYRAANIIHFSFTDGRNYGANGMGSPLGQVYGMVVDSINPVLFMSTQAVKSLLNPNLTTAERALDTFRFATILAHETVHALNKADQEANRGKWDLVYGIVEPYFEDEPISELGWSLENAVFGGPPLEITGNIFQHGGGPSSGAVLRRTWPDWRSAFPAESAPWRNGGLLKGVKPPSWWRHRVSPIPCWYYINLHNPSYWSAYTRRYGTMSIQLGPETVCRDIVVDPATKDWGNVRNDPATTMNLKRLRHQPYINITGDMSQAAIIEATVENQRRAYAERIDQKMFSRMNAIGVYNQSNNLVRQRAYAEANAGRKPLIPTPYPESKVCPMFDYIQDYLFRNRLQLALDTMRMLPENLMYHYILENGGLNIGVSMWRSFLVDCTRRNILFEWMDIGSGQIRRNPLGWPTSNLPDRPRPPGRKPNTTTMKTFHKCANAILYIGLDNEPKEVIPTVWEPFQGGLEDHDLEDFRHRIAAEYSRSYKSVKPGLLENMIVFDKQTMDIILYYCDKDSNVFIYGPKGIIRYPGGANDPGESKDDKSRPGNGCKPH